MTAEETSGPAERWEGAVVTIGETTFTADLAGLDDDTWATAVIPLDQVPETDRPFLAPGVLFLWTVDDTGSHIRIRRADDPAEV